ncbi:MAG: glycosyltransferase, partial [Acidobacteriota bacterium]
EDVGTAVRERICRPEKIKHLGNGIDLRRFDPDRISQAEIAAKRAEVGLPKAPIVGFVGRLVAEKGLLELFAAAQQVRAQIPSVHFVFVGPVDEKPDALSPDTAREYGIADVCHFLGMRRDMPELYALMDVFVLPSHREGFPRAPMEAAAMRVPCVVTDIRGCRETVEQGRNGLLVPLGNTGALADAIIQLLEDRERARRMGEEGRRMAAEHFDERVVFEKVKAEYARLLTAKGISTPTPQIGCSKIASPI